MGNVSKITRRLVLLICMDTSLISQTLEDKHKWNECYQTMIFWRSVFPISLNNKLMIHSQATKDKSSSRLSMEAVSHSSWHWHWLYFSPVTVDKSVVWHSASPVSTTVRSHIVMRWRPKLCGRAQMWEFRVIVIIMCYSLPALSQWRVRPVHSCQTCVSSLWTLVMISFASLAPSLFET